MKLKYLRVGIFYDLMRPFSARARSRRMHSFLRLMDIRQGMTVLDLGGLPAIWETVPVPLSITVLNLPGVAKDAGSSRHQFRNVEGDACRVEGFADGSFDVVFSNSVIEHVGPADKQADFAREVRRLGRSYWVQTPSKWFPIEAHCGMPLWWLYPAALRRYFIEGWRRKLPAWTEMVETTRVLSKADLRRLFPEAAIYVERAYGFPKSYVAYGRGRS